MRHILEVLLKPAFFTKKSQFCYIKNTCKISIFFFFFAFIEFLKVTSISISVTLMKSAKMVTPLLLKIKVV